VDKIVIHGGAPYTDAELNAVSGLQSGQMLSHDSLANAAQHLLDTGLFDDTQVSLSPGGKARTVIFELKPYPVSNLLRASFANFVWLTPDEIAKGLTARVPLYRGVCSDAGTFCDSIDAGLTQLLADKGVTATVSHAIVEPSSADPTRHVVFRVSKPQVHFGVINLTGGPAALQPDLKALVARLSVAPYSSTVASLLLSPLQNAGYLKATLDDVQITPTPDARGIAVNYSAHINEGSVYKIATFSSDAPPPDTSAAQARAARYAAGLRAHGMAINAPSFGPPPAPKPGDVASAKIVMAIQAAAVADLRSKGYLDAYVDPSAKFDETAHTVAYALHAVPGEQYRLKSVTPNNLSPEALEEFQRAWRMKPGDIYNADYVQHLIDDNEDMKQLARYTASFQASADPQTHLVDLTINFFPTAGR
jgi:outer membrane protein insertion porin family